RRARPPDGLPRIAEGQEHPVFPSSGCRPADGALERKPRKNFEIPGLMFDNGLSGGLKSGRPGISIIDRSWRVKSFQKGRPGRRVFREEIREQLIDDIISGRLAPGTRITETRLAQQFGVSQAPVREALRDLELFGFVVSSPFRGTQVRKISTR